MWPTILSSGRFSILVIVSIRLANQEERLVREGFDPDHIKNAWHVRGVIPHVWK